MTQKIYKAKQGETLQSIARDEAFSYQALVKLNPALVGKRLAQGQLIILGNTSAVKTIEQNAVPKATTPKAAGTGKRDEAAALAELTEAKKVLEQQYGQKLQEQNAAFARKKATLLQAVREKQQKNTSAAERLQGALTNNQREADMKSVKQGICRSSIITGVKEKLFQENMSQQDVLKQKRLTDRQTAEDKMLAIRNQQDKAIKKLLQARQKALLNAAQKAQKVT